MTLFARAIERVVDAIHELYEDSDANRRLRRKALRDDFDANLKAYEAELYQDRYATSYAAQEREAQRAAEAFRLKQTALLEKVHRMSEDG